MGSRRARSFPRQSRQAAGLSGTVPGR